MWAVFSQRVPYRCDAHGSLTATPQRGPGDTPDPEVLQHRHHLALLLLRQDLRVSESLPARRSVLTSRYIALWKFCMLMNGVSRFWMAYSAIDT
jgi:hypothetical protein